MLIMLLGSVAIAEEKTVKPAMLLPNAWQERTPISYDLKDGSAWASLGHSSVVLVMIHSNKPEEALTLTMHRVLRFDETNGSPRESEVLLERVFSMQELAKQKAGSLAFRMDYPPYPPSNRITGSGFRYCLRGVLSFAIENNALTKLDASITPIEFVFDDAVPTTSKWIEATNDSDSRWFDREKVKAPWADGKAVAGSANIGTDGKPIFSAPAARPTKPIKPGIKVPTLNLKDESGAPMDLEATER